MKKIFVANRGGIGDAILSLPVLKSLKEAIPNSYLSVMISPDAKPLFSGFSFIDEIIAFDKRESSTYQLIRKLWKYDVALMFDLRYRSALIPFLSRIRIRAGYKEKRGLFLNHPLSDAFFEEQYETRNFADVVKAATKIELPSEQIEQLFLPPISIEDKKIVKNILQEHNITEKTPYIVAAPFTSILRKDWPPEYFQKLFDEIRHKYNLEVIVVGGAGANKENYKFEHVCDLIGETTLLQTKEIMSKAQFYIGGCCANTHIAAAANIPIIGLYGPTTPKRWAPRYNTLFMTRNPSCRCFRKEKTCPGKYADCMKDISVESVAELIDRINKRKD